MMCELVMNADWLTVFDYFGNRNISIRKPMEVKIKLFYLPKCCVDKGGPVSSRFICVF